MTLAAAGRSGAEKRATVASPSERLVRFGLFVLALSSPLSCQGAPGTKPAKSRDATPAPVATTPVPLPAPPQAALASATSVSVPAEAPCCVGLERCLAELRRVEGPDTKESPRLFEKSCASSQLGAMGTLAVRPLIALLTHPDSRVRDGAAAALGEMGPTAHDAVRALIALAGRDPNGRALSALATMEDPRAIEPLIRNLGRGGSGIATRMGRAGVPALVHIVCDPTAPLPALEGAAEALRGIRDKQPEEFAPLTQALIRAVRKDPQGPADPPHERRTHLFGEDTTRLSVTVFAVLQFGKDAAPALGTLRGLVRHPDTTTRSFAREAVVAITGVAGPDAIRFDVDDLTGTDWLDPSRSPDGTSQAVAALGAILASEASPARNKDDRYHHPALDAGRLAVQVLGRIDSPGTVPLLVTALDSPDLVVAESAATALGLKGAPARGASSELARVARTHWSPRVSQAAAKALEALGGQRVAPVAGLLGVPFSGNDNVWRASLGTEQVRIDSFAIPTNDSAQPSNAPLRVVELGEWGATIVAGEVEVWRDALVHPQAILPFAGSFVAVASSQFGSRRDGMAISLAQDASGAWTARILTTFPGQVLGATALRGGVVVAVGEFSQEKQWKPENVKAYRLDVGGRVQGVPISAVPGALSTWSAAVGQARGSRPAPSAFSPSRWLGWLRWPHRH